jgi:hypothetical protein
MILFTEVQKFRQLWLWLMLIAISLVPLYGFIRQVIFEQPFGDKPMSDLGIIIFLCSMILLMLFFWIIKLKTEISEEYISVNFSPFSKAKFLWEDIESAEIVDYGFVGYGIRLGTQYGTIYNTSGSEGLAIKLKGGRKYCIGTKQKSKVREVVSRVLTNKADD